jgi:hypothetical protein
MYTPHNVTVSYLLLNNASMLYVAEPERQPSFDLHATQPTEEAAVADSAPATPAVAFTAIEPAANCTPWPPARPRSPPPFVVG